LFSLSLGSSVQLMRRNLEKNLVLLQKFTNWR
jgi:hypothetical protein